MFSVMPECIMNNFVTAWSDRSYVAKSTDFFASNLNLSKLQQISSTYILNQIVRKTVVQQERIPLRNVPCPF